MTEYIVSCEDGALIKIFDTVEGLSDHFAGELALHVSQAPVGRTFSWFLAGGSTPVPFFSKISFNLRTGIEWDRVKIFWGDERCVGPDAGKATIGSPGKICWTTFRSRNRTFSGSTAKRTRTEAARYSECGVCRKAARASGPDLVMLGLGEDGHTASIFPQSLHLLNSPRLFEATEHPVTGQKRITATGTFINRAKTVIIIATAKATRAAQVIDWLDGMNICLQLSYNPITGTWPGFSTKKRQST